MKKFLFTLAALCLAGNALADSGFFFGTFDEATLGTTNESTLVLTQDDLAGEYELALGAYWSARVSGTECQITFPEGMNAVFAEAGADATVQTLNGRGRPASESAAFAGMTEPYDHWVTTFSTSGYYYDETNTLVNYGVNKWEAGFYEEMAIYYFEFDEGFQGGDIVVYTVVASGNDVRGGTVKENGEHAHGFTFTCHVTVEGAEPPAPEVTDTPVITWTVDEENQQVVVTATGNGTVILYNDDIEVARGEGEATYVVPFTEDPEGEEMGFSATAQEEGKEVSEYALATVEVPGKPAAPEITATPVITYEANEEEQYLMIYAEGDGTVKLYVDGMEVSNPFMYRYQDEEHTIVVTATAQEEGKEISETATLEIVVPAKQLEKTEMPVITDQIVGQTVVVIATGNGHICLYNDDILVAEGEGEAFYEIPFGDDPEGEEYGFSATAQEEGKAVSDYALATVFVPGKVVIIEYTDKPVITTEEVENGVKVIATGNGHICLYVEDILVAEGEGTAEYIIESTELEEEYGVSATAKEEGKEVSEPAVETVWVPALPVEPPYETPAPVVTTELTDDALVITATGEGTVTLYVQYINNETGEMTTETYEGEGTVVVPVARGEEDTFINYWAVAQADEDAVPGITDVEYYVEVPAAEVVGPEDPHATGWWIVLINADNEEVWYPLHQGEDGSWVTTLTLNYGEYGTFYWDPDLSADENNLNRPNVPYYFVVNGQAWGAPEADQATLMGEAANTMSNPLYENENHYTVPVGYAYVLGIYVDPSEDDQLQDGTWYYVYCAQGPQTDVDEVNAAKTVAGVRYFNLAGQEMQEANGMTIVVTTYTDGTTSAVKVMK